MSEFYDEMSDVALETITEFGTTITFGRSVPGEYDPATGTTTGDVILSWPALAVILPASQGVIEAFDVRFQDGTMIESNLRALLVAAQGMARAPLPADSVTFPDGGKWQALGCTPLNPDGGTPLIYNVTVRR